MQPKGKEPGQQVPLPVRLFQARLDKLEAALAAARQDVAANVKADLRGDLATLPANNVVVKDKQADLDIARSDQFWSQMQGRGHCLAAFQRWRP